MFSESSYNPRNVFIKSVISLFVGVGIFFGTFATASCRWFVFDNDGLDEGAFPFLPDTNSTVSVGLFRYQSRIGGLNNEPLLSANTVLCTQYDPLFQRGDTWMFMAQLCVILGPILAFVAWLLAMIAVNKHPTSFFLLLATGVQAASVISAMSLCNEFWDCPWLLGSLTDVVATTLFFLSWLLSMCGLVREQPEEEYPDIDSQFKSHLSGDHPSIIDTTDQESQTGKFTSDSLSYVEEPPKGEDKQSAEDLLGTNDPIIMRAMSQSARVARDMVQRFKAQKEVEGVPEEGPEGDEESGDITDPAIAVTGSEKEAQMLS